MPLLNQELVTKVSNLKEKADKYCTIGIGGLFLLSTLWDIIRFHCYWSDYMLELYSSFFLVLMIMKFLIPSKIPKLLIDLFGIVDSTFGRGIVDIVISLLFIAGKNFFHQFASILLLIVGVIILVLEILAPGNEEPKKNFYPSVNNQMGNEGNNPPTKMDDSQPGPEVLDSNSQKNVDIPVHDDHIKQDF